MIAALWGHILLFVRGCQHPKLEPEGSYRIELGGEPITLFLETCTVCRVTLIHEV